MNTSKRRATRQAFDPLIGQLVAECDTSSARIRAKFTDAYGWCFCEAYRQLQALKSPTMMVEELQAKGMSSQAEIARYLGVSRQAVSAAIKRRAKAVAA
ncbi:HTH domain-containing protein [Ralstonia solanacearum]|uniref:HTH domain-containing protein n=1 Tax=Ralstonia solanacearum TaxID=305 RepID=UPI000F611303|nr:HTH domain-containing protein [Ralstonia solanacearum]